MARFGIEEILVKDSNTALFLARAVIVHNVEYIGRTSDEAEVLFRASIYLHATILRMRQSYDVIVIWTAGSKIVRLTYVLFL